MTDKWTGPTREQKGKWVVREEPPKAKQEIDRTNFHHLVEMTSSRLAKYKKTLSANQSPRPSDIASIASYMCEVHPVERVPKRGLVWAYATHTRADKGLQDQKVILFEKLPTYHQLSPDYAVNDPELWMRAPIIVRPEPVGLVQPGVHLDQNLTHILPHIRTRPDTRSLAGHPDFIGGPSGNEYTKLREYQACEFFGQQIWRHDRELLDCRLEGCKVKISDLSADRFLCLGCGPKTIVRYCSKEHLFADKKHWEECGDIEKLIIKRVIDHTTEPPRFRRYAPAIADIHKLNTFERHRQRLHAMFSCGHYTLFPSSQDDASGETTPTAENPHPVPTGPEIIQWPIDDPMHLEMSSRIERLLNLAFLDSSDIVVLSYLYRLLRAGLQKLEAWNEDMESLLVVQMTLEFNIEEALINHNLPACECEWSPKSFLKHHDNCPYGHKTSNQAGDLHRASTHGGISALVIEKERLYWILRAWRQQHPSVPYWTKRAQGQGFKGVELPDHFPYPYLGDAWLGWGAPDTDIREMWVGGGRSGDAMAGSWAREGSEGEYSEE